MESGGESEDGVGFLGVKAGGQKGVLGLRLSEGSSDSGDGALRAELVREMRSEKGSEGEVEGASAGSGSGDVTRERRSEKAIRGEVEGTSGGEVGSFSGGEGSTGERGLDDAGKAPGKLGVVKSSRRAFRLRYLPILSRGGRSSARLLMRWAALEQPEVLW
jgi:hypothetical protein